MDDLISRQAAIDAIQCDWCKDPIKSIPSAQQWIPCSERLPDNDFTDVLICVHDKRKGCEKDYYIISAYTSGRHWEPTLAVDMTDFDVIAWMPLPEPYEEEK